MLDLKMEVYTQELDLIGFLEIQRSVIWENKAFTAGSFSVESLMTDESLEMLRPENIIWIEGETAGIIEYVQKESGESGPYITVKGRTLTGILDRRVLWGLYNLKGTVPAIMNALVDDCCINPSRGDTERRKIPGLVRLDAPADGDTIQLQATGGTLLERLETLGETYGVAFGVRFNPTVPQMEFWTRWGQDRSIHQSENNPVLYSTELDDVLSSEYTYNSQDYRNVALVAGKGEGADRVYVTVENEVEDDADIPTPTPPEPPVTQQYTVTLLVDPEGGGTVSGGKTVAAGVSVTVTASPSEDYTFVEWQENGVRVSGDRQYTFTVTSDRTLTAVFAATVKVWIVTVNIDPAGAGTVQGGGSVEQGQPVTLTQTTTDGYRFSGWYNAAGARLGTDDTYTFTPTENATITAKYAVIPVYSITATVDPSGSGNVTGAGQYREGATVNLKATENEGYTFTGWKEGGNPVYAYNSNGYYINSSGNPIILQSVTGETLYVSAVDGPTASQLQNLTNNGFTFASWMEQNGYDVSGDPEYSFPALMNRDLVAAFEEIPSSRLPDGYTELEYIQSGGTQWINTDIRPTSTMKFIVDVEPTEAASSTIKYICYSYAGVAGGGYYFYLRWTSSGVSVVAGYASSGLPSKTLSSNKAIRRMKITVDYTNLKSFIDGEEEVTLTNSRVYSTMSTIRLLSGSSTTNAISAKLYSCQMYDGDTATRDFVPCKNPSGEVGLYDIVEGAFYGNAGTGTFTAGPAV